MKKTDVRYGQLFNDQEVDGKAIIGWRQETVKVPNTAAGLMKVATALGHGHYNGIDYDKFVEFGIVSVPIDGEDGAYRVEHVAPVVLLSPDSAGYREVNSRFDVGFKCNIEVDETDWSHDVFVMDTELRNGARIMVQSATSGSSVRAVKRGNEWRVTLSSPILEDGTVYGGWYAETFHSALATV